MNLLGQRILYSEIKKKNSFQFSHSGVCNSLWPHEPEHVRLPYPSPTAEVYPNPCSLSWQCHPTTSSSVIPFSSCPQSFQHQGLFKWVSSWHQLAKVLKFQLQYQSFQEMATHSSILAWRIPWTEEPGGLHSTGSQRVGHNWATSLSLSMNIRDWSLGWTGWISLLSKGLSRVFSNTTVQKHQFFSAQLSLYSQLSHPYMTTGKTIALTRLTFVDNVSTF